MERKKTKIINGKTYKRGLSTYVSKERAQAYAKLLREKGANVVVDKFREKSKYGDRVRTWYFYWIGRKD